MGEERWVPRFVLAEIGDHGANREFRLAAADILQRPLLRPRQMLGAGHGTTAAEIASSGANQDVATVQSGSFPMSPIARMMPSTMRSRTYWPFNCSQFPTWAACNTPSTIACVVRWLSAQPPNDCARSWPLK